MEVSCPEKPINSLRLALDRLLAHNNEPILDIPPQFLNCFKRIIDGSWNECFDDHIGRYSRKRKRNEEPFSLPSSKSMTFVRANFISKILTDPLVSAALKPEAQTSLPSVTQQFEMLSLPEELEKVCESYFSNPASLIAHTETIIQIFYKLTLQHGKVASFSPRTCDALFLRMLFYIRNHLGNFHRQHFSGSKNLVKLQNKSPFLSSDLEVYEDVINSLRLLRVRLYVFLQSCTQLFLEIPTYNELDLFEFIKQLIDEDYLTTDGGTETQDPFRKPQLAQFHNFPKDSSSFDCVIGILDQENLHPVLLPMCSLSSKYSEIQKNNPEETLLLEWFKYNRCNNQILSFISHNDLTSPLLYISTGFFFLNAVLQNRRPFRKNAISMLIDMSHHADTKKRALSTRVSAIRLFEDISVSFPEVSSNTNPFLRDAIENHYLIECTSIHREIVDAALSQLYSFCHKKSSPNYETIDFAKAASHLDLYFFLLNKIPDPYLFGHLFSAYSKVEEPAIQSYIQGLAVPVMKSISNSFKSLTIEIFEPKDPSIHASKIQEEFTIALKRVHAFIRWCEMLSLMHQQYASTTEIAFPRPPYCETLLIPMLDSFIDHLPPFNKALLPSVDQNHSLLVTSTLNTIREIWIDFSRVLVPLSHYDTRVLLKLLPVLESSTIREWLPRFILAPKGREAANEDDDSFCTHLYSQVLNQILSPHNRNFSADLFYDLHMLPGKLTSTAASNQILLLQRVRSCISTCLSMRDVFEMDVIQQCLRRLMAISLSASSSLMVSIFTIRTLLITFGIHAKEEDDSFVKDVLQWCPLVLHCHQREWSSHHHNNIMLTLLDGTVKLLTLHDPSRLASLRPVLPEHVFLERVSLNHKGY